MQKPGTDDHNRYYLLACGSNLYGQLSTDEPYAHGILLEQYSQSANDRSTVGLLLPPSALFSSIDRPISVLGATSSLRVLWTGFNGICVERDGIVYLKGFQCTLAPAGLRRQSDPRVKWTRSLPLPEELASSDVKTAFGTISAFLGIIFNDGRVYTFSVDDWSFSRFQCPSVLGTNGIIDILINRIGQICFLSADGSLKVYSSINSITQELHNPSFASFLGTYEDAAVPSPISKLNLPLYDSESEILQESHNRLEKIVNVFATSTGFVALSSAGNVYTYGDRRFNSLGRNTSLEDDQADYEGVANRGWGQVDALDGIFITKVSANPGGHVQLALAEDGTAYIWGGDGTELIESLPQNRSDHDQDQDEVGMIDIISPDPDGEPVDFVHISCGGDHAVLVEANGKGTWVGGSSDCGQLGFGKEYKYLPAALEIDEDLKKEKGRWRKWDDCMIPKGRSVQVECGPGYTLIVVDKEANEYEAMDLAE